MCEYVVEKMLFGVWDDSINGVKNGDFNTIGVMVIYLL